MELNEIANIKANELYEKQKRIEFLENEFKNTGNMDPNIVKISKELTQLTNEVQKESIELLELQNKINSIPEIKLDLQSPKIQEKPKIKLKQESIDTKVHPSIKTDLVVLGLRMTVGITFIIHGLMKLDSMTIQSGINPNEYVNMLAGIGVSVELAVPIALAELLAGIFLSIGFLSRISSVMIGIIMLGAIFVVKGALVFSGPNGVEFDIIILMCTSLLATFGPGKISVSNIPIKGRIFTRFLQ